MGLFAAASRVLFPVGSARRDRALSSLRNAGVLPPATLSSYQRWIAAFERPESEYGRGASRVTAVADEVQFVIHVAQTDATAAWVTRTLVSLSNQQHQSWTAVLPEPAHPSRDVARLIADAVGADQRLRVGGASSVSGDAAPGAFRLDIAMGDELSPNALSSLSALIAARPGSVCVSAEFDVVDPFTARRSAAAIVGPWEPDLAEQFNLLSGCVARRVSATPEQISSAGLAGAIPHLPAIVVHRRIAPRDRGGSLLEARTDGPPASGFTTSPSSHRGGGTRVRHAVPAGASAVVVVRDPIVSGRTDQRQLEKLLKRAGRRVAVAGVLQWQSVDPFPWELVRQSAARHESEGRRQDRSETAAPELFTVIDGGLMAAEEGWLDDLAGALLRPHVLAVAPLVQVPSGIALDAGLLRREGAAASEPAFRARSGRVDLAPMELARVRSVPALSGRAVVARLADVQLLGGSGSLGAEQFALAAATSQRSLLVWPHQRWELQYGLDAAPTDSPMLAWTRGRIAQWFGPGVEPHQPEPGRVGEGVW